MCGFVACRFEFCAAVDLLGAGKLQAHSNWTSGGGVAADGDFAGEGGERHEAARALLATRIHRDFLRRRRPGWAGLLAVRLLPISPSHHVH